MDNQVAKVIASLAELGKVEGSLRYLASVGIVKKDAVAKGCKKCVKDHPEIQAWIDVGVFNEPRA